MPRAAILSLLLFTSVSCYSQKSSVFISAEAGWSDDHYKIDDSGGRFLAPQLGSGYFGLTIRKLVASHFYIEGGIYTREYHQGVALGGEFSTSGTGRRFAQVPMRIGGRWSFFNDRIAIRPAGGLIFNVTGKYDGGGSSGSVTYQDGDKVEYSYKTLYQTDAFFLANTKLTLECRVGKKIYLGLSGSYNWGLQKIQLQQIEYTVNSGPVINATAFTKGGYNSVTGTFSYRFGN
jgi:hypothetical protein